MRKLIVNCIVFGLLSVFFGGCNSTEKTKTDENKWSFVFMTDIHLEYGKEAVKGFKSALDTVTKLNPDFILTGGDLISDALQQPFSTADSLFNLYNSVMSNIKIPIYNTIGNHENFGWYKKSGIEENHKEYGKKMFEKRISKTYYSFMHKGWCFFVLNSIEKDLDDDGYYGHISNEQIEWLKAELSNLDKKTPIIVSTHIPFATLRSQLIDSSTAANQRGMIIANAKEIYDLLKDYNLQLILQGHLHIFEDLNVYNTRFITGGAVSARWWTGPFEENEEGFVKIDIENDSLVSVKYIDYGWNAKTMGN